MTVLIFPLWDFYQIFASCFFAFSRFTFFPFFFYFSLLPFSFTFHSFFVFLFLPSLLLFPFLPPSTPRLVSRLHMQVGMQLESARQESFFRHASRILWPHPINGWKATPTAVRLRNVLFFNSNFYII
jgi:hypothetical protein